jgi:phosphoribosylaminoimidazolecarboxamide formyltransferase/IMP cyclohydrolase
MQNKQKSQRTALISVYDKTGITEFAKELVNLGWKIISSGGTAKHLTDAGIAVTDVTDITGVPPILSHRVVTLHPKIHGGLLALDTPEHLAELEKYEIPWIDMVCSDLYPLEDEIAKAEATKESVIAQTDMGGIALIRSSAKGRRITICVPEDRMKVLEWLKSGEPNSEEFVNNLAAKAEMTASRYCLLSAKYHSAGGYRGLLGEKKDDCAYGENAYQKPASSYKNLNVKDEPLALHNWQLVAGNPMSYNNFCDLDRMMQTVTHIGAGFEKNFNSIPHVAIGAKHGNACGAGIGESPIEAIDKMLQGDLRAIFGGSVMLNFSVDEKIAEELIHKFSPEGKEGIQRRLLDIVAAPSFTPEAVEILARKKGKCRILVNPNIKNAGVNSLDTTSRFRYVRGGFLTQPNYTFVPQLDRSEKNKDVILAWAVGCTSNSNTITITKDGRLYGNGVGQQDRVGAAKLALFRADDAAKFANATVEKADLENAVAYSDSFFPFPDAPEALINRGIKTIFSTSGSVNDEKIVELCKSKNVNLIMLPDTEARGFYQH